MQKSHNAQQKILFYRDTGIMGNILKRDNARATFIKSTYRGRIKPVSCPRTGHSATSDRRLHIVRRPASRHHTVCAMTSGCSFRDIIPPIPHSPAARSASPGGHCHNLTIPITWRTIPATAYRNIKNHPPDPRRMLLRNAETRKGPMSHDNGPAHNL